MNTPEIFVMLIYEEISGTAQSNILKPRRMLVPQREASRNSASNLVVAKKSQDVVSLRQGHMVKDSIGTTKNAATVLGETQEDASITPPSISGTITKTFDEGFSSFDGQRDHAKPISGCEDDKAMPLSHGESQQTDGKKKVQLSVGNNAVSQGNCWSLLFELLGIQFLCFSVFLAAFWVKL
jgi:serine/threonine-protein kinase TTK/MPS1